MIETNAIGAIILKILEKYFENSRKISLQISSLKKILFNLKEKHNILLYDDKEEFYDDLKILEKMGLIIIEKKNNILLTDLGLKKVKFLELTKEIKNLPRIVNKSLLKNIFC